MKFFIGNKSLRHISYPFVLTKYIDKENFKFTFLQLGHNADQRKHNR